MFQFALTHTNPRLFDVAQTDAKVFALTQTNPRLFDVAQIGISIISIIPTYYEYFYGDPVFCDVHLYSSGGVDGKNIEWQVIADDEAIESSGIHIVPRKSASSVMLSGVYAPSSRDTYFRIRARVEGAQVWVYTYGRLVNYEAAPPNPPQPRDPPPDERV